MSPPSPASSPPPKAPLSLMRSASRLPTAILAKLTGSDKSAPLFIAAAHPEDDGTEQVVELTCGHTARKNDDGKPGAVRSNLSISDHLANLSIFFRASRCPACESQLRCQHRQVGESERRTLPRRRFTGRRKSTRRRIGSEELLRFLREGAGYG